MILSESFVKQTQLPEDLLRLCVDHLTQRRLREEKKKGVRCNSTANASENGVPIISNDQLNTMCQKSGFTGRHALLHTIQAKRRAINANSRVAEKLLDFFGPVHWRSVLDPRENPWSNSVGICPGCGNLIFKINGCYLIECFCGRRFDWTHHSLDSEGVADACGAIARHRQKKQSSTGGTRRKIPELVFQRRILETAYQIVASTVASYGRNQKRRRRRPGGGTRPLLHMEDQLDIVNEIRSESASQDGFRGGDIDHNPNDTNEEPLAIDFLDDYSFSSFSALSFAPDAESCSSSYNYDEWEETSSFGLLSECDTVYSLEDSSDTREETTIMSYCKAAKLGNSVSKRTQNMSIEEIASGYILVDNPHKDRSEKTSSESPVCLKDNPCNETNDDGDHYDDFFLSIYDAAKSGHGGRSSSRFRGNQRQPQRSCGSQNRRSNWTRKRRKEFKNHRQSNTRKE